MSGTHDPEASEPSEAREHEEPSLSPEEEAKARATESQPEDGDDSLDDDLDEEV